MSEFIQEMETINTEGVLMGFFYIILFVFLAIAIIGGIALIKKRKPVKDLILATVLFMFSLGCLTVMIKSLLGVNYLYSQDSNASYFMYIALALMCLLLFIAYNVQKKESPEKTEENSTSEDKK